MTDTLMSSGSIRVSPASSREQLMVIKVPSTISKIKASSQFAKSPITAMVIASRLKADGAREVEGRISGLGKR